MGVSFLGKWFKTLSPRPQVTPDLLYTPRAFALSVLCAGVHLPRQMQSQVPALFLPFAPEAYLIAADACPRPALYPALLFSSIASITS